MRVVIYNSILVAWFCSWELATISNPKCCAGRLKEFWDQLDSKTLAVNVEQAGYEEEMNQDVSDLIDFDEDLYVIVEKDS